MDVQTHLRTEVSGYEKNLWLKEKLLEEVSVWWLHGAEP